MPRGSPSRPLTPPRTLQMALCQLPCTAGHHRAGPSAASLPPRPPRLPTATAGPARRPRQAWGCSGASLFWDAATPSPCCRRPAARPSWTSGPGIAGLGRGAGAAGWGLPNCPLPGAWKAANQLWVWVLRRERKMEGKLAGRLAGMVACLQEEEEGTSA